MRLQLEQLYNEGETIGHEKLKNMKRIVKPASKNEFGKVLGGIMQSGKLSDIRIIRLRCKQKYCGCHS